MPSRRLVPIALVCGVLGACAAYHSRPLPDQPDLVHQLPPLKVDVDKIRIPGLSPHVYNPARGLDMTDAAIAAVINNPQLRATRAAAHAAYVQSFAAGLLPGPQLSASRDRPVGSNPPGTVTAASEGIGYDFTALFTRGAEQASAEAKARQADLDLLWAEWQVAQQARVLFLQCQAAQTKSELLATLTRQVQDRYAGEQRAMAAGDAALDTLSVDLAALQDVEQRQADASRQRIDQCSALDVFMGLDPGTPLKLVAPADPASIPADAVSTALAELPHRRPDLVALRFGYESADADVRKAVLAQFPSISLGITRSSDNSGAHSLGFDVQLGFPFIFGGPSEVHAAEATRDALWAAYQQRLDETDAEVRQTQADLALVASQLDGMRSSQADARRMADAADVAYAHGDLSAPAYYDIANSAISRRLAGIDLALELQQLHIALETLLGLPPQEFQHVTQGTSP